MKSSPIEAPADTKNDNARCIKDGGAIDETPLFERIFGTKLTDYNKAIVNSSDQKQVAATQDVHTISDGIMTTGWSETQFKLDGKSYDIKHRGIHPQITEDGQRQINDVHSDEYQKVMSVYEQVSQDFYDLPKCQVVGPVEK
ncbi:MAG: hypothetical protein JST01_12715 [Cyanobacteria bacterium SZAS TMP-1]|nr:hypothetical protein [Cyanobacteria bacterium SZAS TMP-1]